VGQALSRLFISYSSGNDDWALALQAWLIREGWSGEEDIFPISTPSPASLQASAERGHFSADVFGKTVLPTGSGTHVFEAHHFGEAGAFFCR
jgi:hypothetical protein